MGPMKNFLIVAACASAFSGCMPATGEGPTMNSSPVAQSPIQMADLDCAAHYQTLISVRPSVATLATQRADGAIRAYKADPPAATSAPTPVTDGEILAEVEASSGPRVQRIAGKQENLSGLMADVHACDTQYGHQPTKLY